MRDSHQVDAFANVLLLLDAQLDEVRGIIDAADVGVQKRIDHLHMPIVRGMFQFVLKLLDAVIRERKEERDALVGRFGFADLVSLERGKIVFLRLRSCREQPERREKLIQTEIKCSDEVSWVHFRIGRTACRSCRRRRLVLVLSRKEGI